MAKLFRIKFNKSTNGKPIKFTNQFTFTISIIFSPYHMNNALLNLVRSDIDW